MTGDGIIVRGWVIPESLLEERFDTTGGPGGQHANRNRTSVTLRLVIENTDLPAVAKQQITNKYGPVIEVRSADSRSQWRNRASVRQRLGDMLEEATTPRRTRRPSRPTRAARQRRRRDKEARSNKKRWRRRPGPDD